MKKLITGVLLFTSIAFFGQNKIESTGNVGIGTTNPSSGLEIFKGSTNNLALLLKSSGLGWGSGLQLVNTSGNRYGTYSGSDGKWHFTHEGKGDRLVINSLGNLGIGTSAPTQKLDVNGTVKVGNNNWGGLFIDGKDNNDWLLNAHNDTEKFYIRTKNSDTDYNSFLMTIEKTGNVGIGTTNPDSKLAVNGTIHCEEVLVDLNVAPDYVFEKYYTGASDLKATYTMPTLKEVEAYTKENHHLPNVPSAKTIKEEGLQLKEMTSILLQKIEELTLYTIEQEKRINALEGKLATEK